MSLKVQRSVPHSMQTQVWQAAAASSGQPNAWKSKRRSTEWRVRWLELRLRELKYQQTRYEHLLKLSQNPDAAAQMANQSTAAAPPQNASSSHADEVGSLLHTASVKILL